MFQIKKTVKNIKEHILCAINFSSKIVPVMT